MNLKSDLTDTLQNYHYHPPRRLLISARVYKATELVLPRVGYQRASPMLGQEFAFGFRV